MGYHKDLGIDANSAQVLYKQIIEKNKGKDYKEILPERLMNKSRSLIKKYILHGIERSYDLINTDAGREFYPNGVTKEDIAHYVMAGEVYSNFYLSELFLEKVEPQSIYLDFLKTNVELVKALPKDSNWTEMPEFIAYLEANKDRIKTCQDIHHALTILMQDYGSFIDREDIRNNREDTSDTTFENGIPRLGRGDLCRYFIPVIGLGKNEDGEVTLLNSRNGKQETFKIVTKGSFGSYSVTNEKGETKYIINYDEVASAYEDLFDINKEVYSGWWNRKMKKVII